MWLGWSVPANWVRLEADHSSLQICGPQTCCPGEAAYLCWRQRTSPGDQREFEKSVVRPTERERLARPEAADHAVAWSVLAHFYKACLGLLTSPSLHSNNLSSNLAPPTFPGLYNQLYWSQLNLKMNKYELCHIIVLPFLHLELLTFWSDGSQTIPKLS